MGTQTTVDVLSLEDFQSTLTARLAEVEQALTKLNTEMQCRPPALGTFTDGAAKSGRYQELYQQHVDRVERLKRAVTAAQTATRTILENYRTTEARNAATAADISGVLGGVDTALNEESSPDV